MGRRSSNYPPELPERAVRMIAEGVAGLSLGLADHRVGSHQAGDQDHRDAAEMGSAGRGLMPSGTSEESAEIRRLKWENAELRTRSRRLRQFPSRRSPDASSGTREVHERAQVPVRDRTDLPRTDPSTAARSPAIHHHAAIGQERRMSCRRRRSAGFTGRGSAPSTRGTALSPRASST